MYIIYNKHTGEIDKPLDESQNYLVYYEHFPQEFIDSLASIIVETVPHEITHYRVINEQLVKKSDVEIREIKKYGKVLNDEERLNILLQPAQEEISKAETMLEILSVLQEVELI